VNLILKLKKKVKVSVDINLFNEHKCVLFFWKTAQHKLLLQGWMNQYCFEPHNCTVSISFRFTKKEEWQFPDNTCLAQALW